MNLPPLPRWALYAAAIAVVLSWLPLALIARARAVRSPIPRIAIFQDMDNQPAHRPQSVARIFADRRAMRPRVPGTVARGEAAEAVLVTGRRGADWADRSPLPVTEAFVRRGRERYDIFCATCHGWVGDGNGPTHLRAVKLEEPRWIPPTALISDQVRERPEGHIYNTIAHGIRNMPAYGDQIPVEDRWAIVAYVRALQLRSDAPLEMVPVEQRPALR